MDRSGGWLVYGLLSCMSVSVSGGCGIWSGERYGLLVFGLEDGESGSGSGRGRERKEDHGMCDVSENDPSLIAFVGNWCEQGKSRTVICSRVKLHGHARAADEHVSKKNFLLSSICSL